MSRKIIILVTNTYPYGYGESFLETEIYYLSKSFDKIIIIPFRKESYIRSFPENIQVVNILTETSRFNILFSYAIKTLIFNDFWEELNSLVFNKRIFNFIRILVLYCKSLYIKEEINNFIKRNKLEYENIIFYTYWLTSAAYGLGLLKQEKPIIRLVSRAHGYDLYAERAIRGYVPMQYKSINRLDKLYLISNDGYRYLCAKYARSRHLLVEKLKVSRLGVKRTVSNVRLVKQENSIDCPFVIVTCSSFASVKRIDLLIDALSILDTKSKEKKIEWHHIGGGGGQKDFEKIAKKCLCKQVSFQFHGTLTNKQVLKLYKETWFDLFINMSDSEGVPVSIMEAFSFGVPVLARKVGGISEIVNNKNGLLLDTIVTPEQIAETLLTLIFSKDDLLNKRKAASDTWESRFNADINYKQFVDCLIRI